MRSPVLSGRLWENGPHRCRIHYMGGTFGPDEQLWVRQREAAIRRFTAHDRALATASARMLHRKKLKLHS
jgi:hypothetical protein